MVELWAKKTPIDLEGFPIASKDLLNAHNVLQGALRQFWELWVSAYIQALPPIASETNTVQKISPGELVLLRHENQKRVYWPTGRIVKVFPGKDKVIRSVTVKMADGALLNRSVQKLHRLEFFEPDADFDELDNSEIADNSVTNPANESEYISIPGYHDTECDLGEVLPSSNVEVVNLPEVLQTSDVSDNVSETPTEGINKSRLTTRTGRLVRAPNKLNL